jgi:hypothetical protein
MFINLKGIRMGELHDFIHSKAATATEVVAARVVVTPSTRLRRSLKLTTAPNWWWIVENGKVVGNGRVYGEWAQPREVERITPWVWDSDEE